MQDVIFVVNPRAASGRAAKVWYQLRDQIGSIRRARCVDATDPQEARRQLVQLLDDRVRRVVAIGGDGTVNHTANVLLDSGLATALGLVPVGSGSDTARGLRLVARPREALERALGVNPRPVDVMQLQQGDTTRWVVNIASIGMSGLVAGEVNKLEKRWAGTYLWTALKSLARYRPGRVRVYLDDQLWYEGGLVLMAIANGTAFARGMRIAPHALADDGLADVVLVRETPLLKILPYVPRLYTGSHLDAPFVQWARAARVRVEPMDPLPPFEMDGELAPCAPAEYRVIPGALQVVY